MPVDLFAPKAFSPAPLPEAGQLENDYHEAFHAWKQAPTPETSHALLTKVEPVISEAVRSYGAGSQGSPTLKTRAKLMAMDAMHSYDPAKGSLRTHLLSNLRGLQRVGAGEANIIGMPEQVALDRRHLQETERELADRLGRPASDAELADETGLSIKRINYVRQAQGSVNVGALGVGQNEEAFMPASRVVGQSDDDAWVDLVYHGLSPRDQVILQHTLGWQGHPVLSTAEIAQKLGVTPGMVSQRRKIIQAELDKRQSSNLGI